MSSRIRDAEFIARKEMVWEDVGAGVDGPYWLSDEKLPALKLHW